MADTAQGAGMELLLARYATDALELEPADADALAEEVFSMHVNDIPNVQIAEAMLHDLRMRSIRYRYQPTKEDRRG